MITKMLRDQNGSIAMMSGLFMAVMVPTIMAAIDMTNVTTTKESVQNRLDGAIIAAAQFSDLSDASTSGEMQKRGEKFIFNSLSGNGVEIENPITTFTYNENTNELNATIEFDAPTLFVGKVLAMNRIKVESQLTPKEAVELEVALSLDISGSMAWEIASDTPAPVGSRRIDALKEGVDSMIAVFAENPLVNARISIIPYSSAVNISEIEGSDDDGGGVWATERAERNGAGKLKISKLPPGRGLGLKKKNDIGTPDTVALPLSSVEDATAHVATMIPGGGTAGHIGAEWALYSLLPDWDALWNQSQKPPAPVASKARKVLVMMTDGDFTVTHTPDMTIEEAYEIFQDICSTARDAGIAVYTVGLKASDKTDTELSKCAGLTDNYFPVASRTGIADAFKEIGEDATKLRISQ